MPVKKNGFDSINVEAATRASLTAMGAAALQVAQPAAPVITGNLKRSHKYQVDMASKSVFIGASAEYAAAVHNGTKKRRGKPWLRETITPNAQKIAEFGARKYGELL